LQLSGYGYCRFLATFAGGFSAAVDPVGLEGRVSLRTSDIPAYTTFANTAGDNPAPADWRTKDRANSSCATVFPNWVVACQCVENPSGRGRIALANFPARDVD